MYIDFDIDVDRTQLTEDLQEAMNDLDMFYKENKDGMFGLRLPRIITFTESAYANHRINDRTLRLIRKRYGIV